MRRGICFCLLLVVLVTAVPTTLAADPYLDYGVATKTIRICYFSGFDSFWTTRVNEAIGLINGGSSGLTVINDQNVDSYLTISSSYEMYAGVFHPVRRSGSTLLSFEIYIFKTFIEADVLKYGNDTNSANKYRWSVINHEFCHAFWLMDNPNTSSGSLMKYSRDYAVTYYPTDFDISNIKKKYGY